MSNGNVQKIIYYLKELSELSSQFMREHVVIISDPFKKSETKLAQFQHKEKTIVRDAKNDRRHPVDPVIIHTFNRKTGENLDEVKMIYGPNSDEYARSKHSLAFTIANIIYFRNGAFKPETEEGRKLLMHELTHVAQNKKRNDYKNVTVDQKEEEAELNEKIEQYNPDPVLTAKIGNREYTLKKSDWKKINIRAHEQLEHEISLLENTMSEEEYFNLLLKYQKWEQENSELWT